MLLKLSLGRGRWVLLLSADKAALVVIYDVPLLSAQILLLLLTQFLLQSHCRRLALLHRRRLLHCLRHVVLLVAALFQLLLRVLTGQLLHVLLTR